MKYIVYLSAIVAMAVFSCTKDRADLPKAPEQAPVSVSYCDSMKSVNKVSYQCFVDSVMKARCVQCHKAGGIAEFHDLTTYSGVKNRASTIADIIQANTANPIGRMPQGGPFLSTDTINKIISWVNEGALNN